MANEVNARELFYMRLSQTLQDNRFNEGIKFAPQRKYDCGEEENFFLRAF